MGIIYSVPSRYLFSILLLCSLVIPVRLHAGRGAAAERRHGAKSQAAEITSVSVARTTFNPGDSIAVAYTTSDAFNSGNVFTAQISSLNGSFAQARVIG